MNLDRIIGNRASVGRVSPSSAGRTGFVINSAYSHGVSGNAIGFRYTCGSTDAINEVYVFADAFQDLANVTMECRVYNEGANFSRPGSTLHATSTTTTNPSGNDMWIKFAFSSPYNPAIGEIVWIVVINTSADPVNDYPTILTVVVYLPLEQFFATGGWGQIVPHTSTNGFSTSGAVASRAPIIIQHGSDYYGNPWIHLHQTYYTNNTLERGIRLTCTEDVTVSGAVFVGAAAYDKFRITLSTTIPGAAVGAGEVEYDLDASGGDDINGCIIFDTPFTLLGGTAYNVTLTYAANSQLPYVLQIEDHTSYSSMFNTLRGYDTFSMPWGIISDGGGTPAWVEDKTICPSISLIISDFPAQAAGGGGGLKLAGRGGLAG